MRKFNFNGLSAYAIYEDEDGFYIINGNCFAMEAEQMRELAIGLIKYADKHEKDLKDYNAKREIEFNKELYGWCKREKREPNYSGYVYFLECGGKYKIGYSKNVEKRIKGLDYRPFEINLIVKSKQISNAYVIEKDLHAKYEKYKITGEWYSFNEEQVETIKNFIISLEER